MIKPSPLEPTRSAPLKTKNLGYCALGFVLLAIGFALMHSSIGTGDYAVFDEEHLYNFWYTKGASAILLAGYGCMAWGIFRH